jgi:hypothetical protein
MELEDESDGSLEFEDEESNEEGGQGEEVVQISVK